MATNVLNPKTRSYEFFGPVGATLVSLAVPPITYLLYFGCSEASGGCPPRLDHTIPELIFSTFSSSDFWKGLWDTQAALIYFGWYAFCVVAWAVIPGDIVEGTTLRTGEKIRYKINGTRPFSFSSSLSVADCGAIFSVQHVPLGAWDCFGVHRSQWTRGVYLHL